MSKRKLVCLVLVVCIFLGSFVSLLSYAADSSDSQTNSTQTNETTQAEATTAIPEDKKEPEQTTEAEKPSTTENTQEQEKVKEPEKTPEEDESLWYSTKIPMKKDHQKLLWDYCKKRGLDYIDMLSLISVESNFNEKCSSSKGRYKGYFQISNTNAKNLAKSLKTPNTPLDGAVNINWGTAMFSWIMKDKRVTELKKGSKRDVALSIYQRGSRGYDKHGLSKSFLKVFYKKRGIISAYFAKDSEK